MPGGWLLGEGENGSTFCCYCKRYLSHALTSQQYHTDGERDLGPIIASMSLGGEASFSIRVRGSYNHSFVGKSENGKDFNHYDPNIPIVAGSWKPDKRREVNEAAKKMKPEQLTEYAKKQLFEDIKTRTIPCKKLLELSVKHGDILIQGGPNQQIHYEHEAEPKGKLRYAITNRSINTKNIPAHLHHLGDHPESLRDPKLAYDGSMSLYQAWYAKRFKSPPK